MDGPVSRSKCPSVVEWQAELGRATRRIQLQTEIDQNSAAPAGSVVVQHSDPAATALQTYLAALGLTVPTGIIGQWIVLIPVVALELGSALAMVLVQAVSPRYQTITIEPPKPLNRLTPRISYQPRNLIAEKVIDKLKSKGGTVNASERSLAAEIGADRNAVRRTLLALAACGTILVASSREGSHITLA